MCRRFQKGVFVDVIFALGILSVFFGCDGKKSVNTVVAPKTIESRDPMGKYDPPIGVTTARTLSQVVRFDASDPDKRSLDENRWVRHFKQDLGIIMTHKWVSTDQDSDLAKWSAAIASGDVPDFAVVNDPVYKQLYEADMIADMGDILAAYGSGSYLSLLTQSDYDQMSFDGTLLGFPGPAKGFHGSTLLFVRQDWLDKVNLSLPKTIEDVIETARVFKEAQLGGPETIGLLFSNNITGGHNFVAGDGKWDGFFNGFGAYINYWLEKDGKLVYSNIQPEVKNALLRMQELYRAGIINRDFAVINDAIAREYVASGKVGIFYSTAWDVVQSMFVAHNNDPGADFVPLEPPSIRGQHYKFQTNTPMPQKIFVSKKYEHPEAVVKIANFYDWARNEDVQYYSEGPDGFPYFQLMPWSQFSRATDDLDRAEAIRYAESTGSTEKLNTQIFQRAWEMYQQAKEGEAPYYHLTMFGKRGSFSLLYDLYHADRILLDGYLGLPTETQSIRGGVLDNELNASLFDVVMGADISVYEKAVQNWLGNGGNKVTEEVNQWYSALKGK
jgi:putative aldouronate transport system substrate-binding protein